MPFEKPEKKEKPGLVYHSSHDPNIEEFTPRQETMRDPSEGPRIFATPDKALATAFLVEGSNDNWMQVMYSNDVLIAVIRKDKDEFINNDKGGVLYTLPGDTFEYNPNLGMKEREGTSKVSVKPISKINYPSSLNAMIDNGVQVYFVNQNTFDQIKNADDPGMIFNSLTSENQRQGKA